jgi:DNA-binding XRE family transcriptional regulator
MALAGSGWHWLDQPTLLMYNCRCTLTLGGKTMFGATLKRLREKAGLTRYGLANAAGLKTQQLDHLEANPGAVPRWDTVCKLADALGVPLEAFRVPEKIRRK